MSSDDKEDKLQRDVESFPCPQCGIVFGINCDVLTLWRENQHRFFCPNGHTLAFANTKSTDEVTISALREKVQTLEKELDKSKKESKKLHDSIAILQHELEIWKPRSTA